MTKRMIDWLSGVMVVSAIGVLVVAVVLFFLDL